MLRQSTISALVIFGLVLASGPQALAQARQAAPRTQPDGADTRGDPVCPTPGCPQPVPIPYPPVNAHTIKPAPSPTHPSVPISNGDEAGHMRGAAPTPPADDASDIP